MSLRKSRLTITLLAGAAAVAIGTGTALAAPATITVTNPNADNSATGHSDLVQITNDRNGLGGECTSVDLAGSIPSGQYTLPAAVGEVADLTFGGCSGPLGGASATANGLPYTLTFTAFDGAHASSGYVGEVNIAVDMSGCTFDIVGNIPGSYTEDGTNGTLSLGGTLPSGVTPPTAQNVASCQGVVANGDSFTVAGDFALTSPTAPPITVTAP